MSLQRPGFKPNVQRNKKVSRANDVFFSIAPETTARLRFMPPADESGLLFALTVNHFKLQDAEGRPIAVACANQHGEGNCPVCAAVTWLYQNGNKDEKKIGSELRASARYNAQVLVAERVGDGWEYEGPRMVAFSKTVHDNIIQILENQEMVGDPDFTDPDEGQDLLISRKGSGLNTEYTVDRSGKKMALDTAFPAWTEKFWTDLYKVLGLRILSHNEMIEVLQSTYAKQLDFDAMRADGVF